MPKRALIERRPWLLASMTLALAFYVLQDSRVPGLYLTVIKGLPVALLAIYAWLRHAGFNGRMIACVMALGALGDVTFELDFVVAGSAFALGHICAIILYLRVRRAILPVSQRLAAIALLIGTPVIAFLLIAEPSLRLVVTLYALVLGAMAAAAWTSGFPRYRVGIGAVLFVASDLLIFAWFGPLAHSPVPDLLIWPLYYVGQFLICTGVIQASRSKDAGDQAAIRT